jgi:hypothetical protein
MNVCALDSYVQLCYRSEKLIAGSERRVKFVDASAMQALAHYQPQNLAPVPTRAPV